MSNYYYYKIDKRNNPVLGSNFKSNKNKEERVS